MGFRLSMRLACMAIAALLGVVMLDGIAPRSDAAWAAPACTGDVNRDTNVNALDLQLVAQHFGPCPPAIVAVAVSNLPITGTPINGFGPFERDMSNGENGAGDGNVLTINAAAYPKGLGVHADSILRFPMPPGCTQFQAQAGIDDEVGANGSVTFEVWDGTATRLYQSPVKTGADAASSVSVDITGVAELRLVVTKGASDAFDHADWADAKITCANDGVAPLVSNVGTTASAFGATVTWTTDEIANTQIEYGLTALYGATSPLDAMLTTAHAGTVTGLNPSTTYHYRVRTRDIAGNLATSPDATFTTTASLFAQAAAFGTGTHAHSVVLRDVNGDGNTDVITANAGSDTISVLLGNGAGGFATAASYATGSQPKSVALGDVNGDGKLDAVTANMGDRKICVMRGDPSGRGTFGARTDLAGCTNAHEVTLATLDNNASLDIACAGWGAPFMGVLLNNGSGGFAPMVSYAAGAAPHSIAAAYFNNDGALDLAVANHDNGTISVFLGNGDGTFQAQTAYASGTGPHSLRIDDLDGDGHADIVNVNDASNDVSVFLGDGAGNFAAAVKYATRATPKGVAIADVNGDGNLDILAATINGNYPSLIHPGGDSVSVLLGNGGGTFEAKADYAVGQGSFAVAAGRINADAKLDIVTANWWDNGITLRMNTSP
jgi:hypothetical protein